MLSRVELSPSFLFFLLVLPTKPCKSVQRLRHCLISGELIEACSLVRVLNQTA
jgi:hypothetical protein